MVYDNIYMSMFLCLKIRNNKFSILEIIISKDIELKKIYEIK